MTAPDPAFEDFTARYDMRALEMREAEAVRAHRRSLERAKHAALAVAWIALACTIVGVTTVVWLAARGPSTYEQQEQDARLECIHAAGVWIPGATGADETPGTCAVAGTLP